MPDKGADATHTDERGSVKKLARVADGIHCPERFTVNYLSVAVARKLHGKFTDDAVAEELA